MWNFMIRKHEGENGIRIIHEKLPHVRALSVGIWIQAGSNDEREEEAGLAHFIEHMLFKGTKKYSAKHIAEQFDRIGGELNAFTSKEATCFHATILKEDAEIALELLADMLFNSVFDEEEMAKEKQVVLEEIAMYEDTPEDEVHEQLWRTMFPNHAVGKPVLGSRDSVMRFTKQLIRQFMKRLYRPERIVISIAGNYDDQLIDYIETLFNSFEEIEREETLTAFTSPDFHAKQIMTKKEIEQVHLCLGFPSLALQDKRKYELALVDQLIGGSMSSRLFQEVREKHGLAYSIYSYYTLYEMTGVFIIYGGTAPRNLKALQKTIVSVLQEAAEKGITKQELIQAKEAIKNSFLLGLESTESRMSRNGHQELFRQPHLTADEVIEKIELVTQDNVERLIKEIFNQPFARSTIRPG